MFSIRATSTFNYLFGGLLFLLVLTSVEGLPTKASPSCPLHAPKSLHKRSTLVHPSGTKTTTLFHGTSSEAAAKSMAAGVKLSETNVCGDLHHNNDKKSEGGAYFTDSVIAAAQYACYSKTYNPAIPVPDMVHVLEFTWTPGSHTVYEFKDLKSMDESKCRSHDMITSPMHDEMFDKDLTPSFWQYALVKQSATSGLAYHHTYDIHCKNVPKAAHLTDELYEHGQGGNPKFQELVKQLTSATSC